MKRFYVSAESIKKDKIYLSQEELHHLKDVLRFKEGDKVAAFDGKGKEYSGYVIKLDQHQLVVKIESSRFTLAKDAPYKVTLIQAVSKTPKIDLVVQKSTELGVDKIIPLSASRSIIKLDNKSANTRKDRWQRIAKEASKQCGRTTVPVIDNFLNIEDALDLIKGYDLKLFFCINKEAVKFQNVLNEFKGIIPKEIAIFIGPEGDFTEEEVFMAKNSGCILVSLGERVLRTETAGLYVLSVLDYVFNF